MSNGSKHVHYEMIVAKATNMDLVVLSNIAMKASGKTCDW